MEKKKILEKDFFDFRGVSAPQAKVQMQKHVSISNLARFLHE